MPRWVTAFILAKNGPMLISTNKNYRFPLVHIVYIVESTDFTQISFKRDFFYSVVGFPLFSLVSSDISSVSSFNVSDNLTPSSSLMIINRNVFRLPCNSHDMIMLSSTS